jgi:hypothetical protein
MKSHPKASLPEKRCRNSKNKKKRFHLTESANNQLNYNQTSVWMRAGIAVETKYV